VLDRAQASNVEDLGELVYGPSGVSRDSNEGGQADDQAFVDATPSGVDG